MGKAECPVALKMTLAEWNPVRVLWQGYQMLPEPRPFHSLVNGIAVAGDVEVTATGIDYTLPMFIGDIRLSDPPFLWHFPVEYFCAGWHVVRFNRDFLL